MKIRVLPILVVAGLVAWLVAGRRDHAVAISGMIEVDEVRVASRAGGRVAAIYAREGDSTTNGQVLVRLAADDVRARRDLAAARLAELEHGARPEEIAAAKSEWEALEADLEFAMDDAQRKSDLYVSKSVSSTDRDEAVTRAASLKQKVAAAKSRYELLLAGPRAELIDQARAQLGEYDDHVAELDIRAPSDAVLESLLVKVGDVVAPNAPVATLLIAGERWLRVYVPEPWVAKVRVGEPVTLTVDAYPGETFRGVIQQLARKAEFTPRNVQTPEERVQQVFGVKIRVEDDSGRLRAGMTASVDFDGEPQR